MYMYWGICTCNYCFLCSSAKNIHVDTDGEIDSASQGYPPGKGTGAGIEASGLSGGSGGSHGGLGGRGSVNNYASPAYDSVLIPRDFGSGGNTLSHYKVQDNKQVGRDQLSTCCAIINNNFEQLQFTHKITLKKL